MIMEKYSKRFVRRAIVRHCGIANSDVAEAFPRQGNATKEVGGKISHHYFGSYERTPSPELVWVVMIQTKI